MFFCTVFQANGEWLGLAASPRHVQVGGDYTAPPPPRVLRHDGNGHGTDQSAGGRLHPGSVSKNLYMSNN